MKLIKNPFYQPALVLFIITFFSYITGRFYSTDPRAHLNISELIEYYKYPLEVHSVITKDNYILTLYRIPNGFNTTNTTEKKTPVLLMHGAFNSAAEFICLGPNKSLGLILADQGYDVWLGNSRGTGPSRKHVFLNPDTDSQFWNFTLTEFGVYDIPVIIDHILNSTKEEKIHYIGFSKGTTDYFIALSEYPEYAKKIRLMTALAPSVYLTDMFSPGVALINLTPQLFTNFVLYREPTEMNSKEISLKLFQFFCYEESIMFIMCKIYYFLMQGGLGQINPSLLPVIHANNPASTSRHVFLHLFQTRNSEIITKLDYGKEKNLEIYGQQIPPKFNFNHSTPPTAIYYSENDGLVNEKNMPKFLKLLPNVVKMYKVPSDTFNHLDFIVGENTTDLLYNSVIEEMQKY